MFPPPTTHTHTSSLFVCIPSLCIPSNSLAILFCLSLSFHLLQFTLHRTTTNCSMPFNTKLNEHLFNQLQSNSINICSDHFTFSPYLLNYFSCSSYALLSHLTTKTKMCVFFFPRHLLSVLLSSLSLSFVVEGK